MASFGFVVQLGREDSLLDMLTEERKLMNSIYSMIEEGGWWGVRIEKVEEGKLLKVTARVNRMGKLLKVTARVNRILKRSASQ